MSAASLQLARMAVDGLSAQERRELLRAYMAPPVVSRTTRIVRRAECARRLGVTLRTIDNLASAGTLRRIRLPGRKRGAGFREEDLDRLINGSECQASAEAPISGVCRDQFGRSDT